MEGPRQPHHPFTPGDVALARVAGREDGELQLLQRQGGDRPRRSRCPRRPGQSHRRPLAWAGCAGKNKARAAPRIAPGDGPSLAARREPVLIPEGVLIDLQGRADFRVGKEPMGGEMGPPGPRQVRQHSRGRSRRALPAYYAAAPANAVTALALVLSRPTAGQARCLSPTAASRMATELCRRRSERLAVVSDATDREQARPVPRPPAATRSTARQELPARNGGDCIVLPPGPFPNSRRATPQARKLSLSSGQM